MQEEFLPLTMLMHHLRGEAESRKSYQTGLNFKEDHATEWKLDQRHGMRRDKNRRGCFACGKEGHVRKNCPGRQFEPHETSSSMENIYASPSTGTKTGDGDKRTCFSCGKEGHLCRHCPHRKFEPSDNNGKEKVFPYQSKVNPTFMGVIARSWKTALRDLISLYCLFSM